MNLTLLNRYDFLDRFYRLAIVNIISNIMVPLAGTINVAFLGHLAGIHHLAGASLATILFTYIYYSWTFLRMATTGVTAQAVGRDDREGVLLVALRNGLLALAISALILILQNPLRDLGFALLSGNPEVQAAAVTYYNARIWGAPAVLLNFVVIGWFLGREMSSCVLLLSLVNNVSNIVLDYLFIIRWDWATTGAGLATAMSQYLMLFLGLIFVSREISWQEVKAVSGKIWDTSAFKATFTLNANLLVWSLAFSSTYFIFTNISAAMGMSVLAENALLLQAVFLSIYFFEGVGYATTTLSGYFKGQNERERFLPLLQIAVGSSLFVGLTIAGMFSLFPKTLFGLLTDHADVTEAITIYVPWLLPVLGGVSIALILEGFLTGLEQGHILRNATLIGTVLGFVPLAILAWQFHNNHVLWLGLSMFMAIRVLVLGLQLPKTLESNTTDKIKLLSGASVQ
jgi:MATE family multidrug resistance protein